MITCPECQHAELEGSLFCSNCGSNLLTGDEADTSTIKLPAGDASGMPSPPPLVGKRVGPAVSAAAIRFVIVPSSRQITLGTQDRIHIGRGDPGRDILPELDLAHDGAAEAGVSRMHAVVLSTAQGIAIMDLDSVNGTHVNGFRLPPNLPFALNDGDTLLLGDLKILVFFEG
jgi:hypothetical protein